MIKNGFDYQNRIIYWNPNAFSINTNKTIAFPATILAHEGAHALQYDKYGKEKYKELKETEDPEYGDWLEEEVIEEYEWNCALLHGDINELQITRDKHDANIIILSNEDYSNIFNKEITGFVIPNIIPEYSKLKIINFLRKL